MSLRTRVAMMSGAALAVGLVVTGCGSGDPEPADSSSQSSQSARATPSTAPPTSATASGNAAASPEPSAPATDGPSEAPRGDASQEALGKAATDTSGGDGRGEPSVAPAVPADEAADSGSLKVGLEPLQEKTLDDSVPGEIAGPSTKLTFRLENTGTEPVQVGQAFVQADKGSQNQPAVERDGRREGDFSAPVEPGASRSLTFYVAGSPDELSAVRFGYSPDQALVQFEVR